MKRNSMLQSLEEAGYRWEDAAAMFPSLALLRQVKQDARYHEEGDVYRHTQLVCQALTESAQWQQLSKEAKGIVYLAAMFHDIGKLTATREDATGISSPKHTIYGERLFRSAVYTGSINDLPFASDFKPGWGLSFAQREQVAALIRFHGLPVWFAEKSNPQKALLFAAERVCLHWLFLLALADHRGRISRTKEDFQDRISYFAECAEEYGCLYGPYPFADACSRTAYFYKKDGWPGAKIYDSSRSSVTVLCGLPLSGKDTYIAAHLAKLPVVSLDDIREEMGVAAGSCSAQAAAIGRERAKAFLRQGQPFVWNATNLRQELRLRLLQMCMDYGASVRLLYLEEPWQELLRRNDIRSRSLPRASLQRMADTMELPLPWEAPCVEYRVCTSV